MWSAWKTSGLTWVAGARTLSWWIVPTQLPRPTFLVSCCRPERKKALTGLRFGLDLASWKQLRSRSSSQDRSHQRQCAEQSNQKAGETGKAPLQTTVISDHNP